MDGCASLPVNTTNKTILPQQQAAAAVAVAAITANQQQQYQQLFVIPGQKRSQSAANLQHQQFVYNNNSNIANNSTTDAASARLAAVAAVNYNLEVTNGGGLNSAKRSRLSSEVTATNCPQQPITNNFLSATNYFAAYQQQMAASPLRPQFNNSSNNVAAGLNSNLDPSLRFLQGTIDSVRMSKYIL